MTSSVLDRDLAAPGVFPVVEHADVTLLRDLLERLSAIEGDPGRVGVRSDAERIDQLRLLEEIKSAAAGAQARITVEFEASQLRQQADAGVLARQRGKGIGDQVALARGPSAAQGARHLGFATAVVREMPHTHALLRAGRISEWAATLLVRETAVLTREDRATVDERLCALTVHAGTGELTEPRVIGLTPRRVEAAARALAVELDAEAVVRRAARAARDRRVTVRPAPDTMSYVTGLLPVPQGVAVFASLRAAARAARAGGDERTEARLMADLFVERLTGQATAAAVPAEIQLVMTPDALMGASDRPARIGDVVVPAQVARDLAVRTDAPRWLRRVFADPVIGVVTSLDARRRRFFGKREAREIVVRDQACRQPGCDSAIAHRDHVRRVADGGPSVRTNGQGLCEAHNLVKELPGWRTRVADARPGHHTVETTTPTGHTYRSQAPPGLPPPL
jgi:hypothetical protein